MLALLLLLSAQSPPACAVDGTRPIATALAGSARLAGLAALFPDARASRGAGTLVLDERVEPVTLLLPRTAIDVTLPLALPAGARATLSLSAKLDRPCLDARAVWADDELMRIEAPLRAEATVRLERGGHERTLTWKIDSITTTPSRLELTTTTGEMHALYVGRALPSVATLTSESSGAARFQAAMMALDAGLLVDLENDRSRAARSVSFLVLADRLHDALPAVLPVERLAIGARLDPAALEPALRPLARYWQSAFSASVAPAGATARMLIGDDVSAVFVDGRSVFDRARGTSTSAEIPARGVGMRVWIVNADKAPTVFDTTVVVRPGEIYNVGAQRFSPVSGGARRECIRVRGRIVGPSGAAGLRWRELGSPPGPLMGSDEAFRPSGSQDRREVSVVDAKQNAARVPPAPLVYSYTHEGTYEWVVSPEGTATLRLLPDVKLCAPDGGDAPTP